MDRIRVDENDEYAARAAAKTLAKGGAIVFPAERLYGLGADATNAAAVARVFALKARPEAMPLPVIVPDMESALLWVEASQAARSLMQAFWPGPLTLVLPIKKPLVESILGEGRLLGIRAPGNQLARKIARLAGVPVIATSANLSGQAPGRSADEAVASLSGEVDLVLDAGRVPGPPGSTVVKVREHEVEIVRQGVIGQEQIFNLIRGKA